MTFAGKNKEYDWGKWCVFRMSFVYISGIRSVRLCKCFVNPVAERDSQLLYDSETETLKTSKKKVN